MNLKKDLTSEESEILISRLNQLWKNPFTGIPNSEAVVVLAEIIRRNNEEQKRTNRIQFWFNVLVGISTIVLSILSLLKLK